MDLIATLMAQARQELGDKASPGDVANRALALMAARVKAAEEAANAPIKFAVSEYPGAVEISGLGFGWKAVRVDAHNVEALIARADDFRAFVKANHDKVRQDAGDGRFEEARRKVKAESAAKKAAATAPAATGTTGS